jgi:phage terminase large subunit GpA-like protein
MSAYQQALQERFGSLLERLAEEVAPRRYRKVSEWAEDHAYLDSTVSAEPGPWRSYPYQIAMMDAFVEDRVEIVVAMKSARVGWTRILGNVVGYYAHVEPSPILLVQPTQQDAYGEVRDAIDSVLSRLPIKQKRIGSHGTIFRREFPGGLLYVIGSNSPRSFRRITVRLVLFDEVDAYPIAVRSEGDPIFLGMARATTYYNRKIAIGSTPTLSGVSRIEEWWEKSEQGHFLIPCCHCGVEHVRVFRKDSKAPVIRGKQIPKAYVDWQNDDPSTANWICETCGAVQPLTKNLSMLKRGRWLADRWSWELDKGFTFAPNFNGVIGFRIWAGYALHPLATPAEIVKGYLRTRGDDRAYTVFVNTVLGEPFENTQEKVPWEVLRDRAEPYTAEAPEGVLCITAGVDVQGDRLECEVVGWGFGEESWSLDYHILPGNPTQTEVWDQLEQLLQQPYHLPGGIPIYVSGVCVDSGYLTKSVYEFTRRTSLTVWPTKGVPGPGRPMINMISRAHHLKRRALLARGIVTPVILGVDEAKALLYNRLSLVTEPGPGYCHFPTDRPAAWYQQLVSERLITTRFGGKVTSKWVITHGQRNEALDCRILAMAAIQLLRPNFDSLQEELTRRRDPIKPKPDQETEVQAPPTPKPKRSLVDDSWQLA